MPGFGFEPREPHQPIILISAAGYETFKFSYSLANEMKRCGKLVDWKRLQGFRKKKESAAQHLGKVVESTLAIHYKMGVDPVETFTKEWEKCKNWSTLEYSEKSSIDNWEGFLRTGQQWMMQLNEQSEKYDFLREGIFGEELKLQDWYKRSPLSYIADWHTRAGGGLLLDIKVTGKVYPQNPPGLASLDPQLATGALVSGIQQVGFLNFVRVVKDPRIQIVRAAVSKDRMHETDLFLREQYDRIVASRFYRTGGTRWPDDACTNCEMLPLCLNMKSEIAETLTKKESRETTDMMNALDEMD